MKHSRMKLAQEALRHKGFMQKIPAAYRMLKAWRSGRYNLRFVDILFPALALVYLLSPIDLIPDFVPFIGALDDLAVLAFAIPMLLREVDKYLIWEIKQKNASKQAEENVLEAEVVE